MPLTGFEQVFIAQVDSGKKFIYIIIFKGNIEIENSPFTTTTK